MLSDPAYDWEEGEERNERGVTDAEYCLGSQSINEWGKEARLEKAIKNAKASHPESDLHRGET